MNKKPIMAIIKSTLNALDAADAALDMQKGKIACLKSELNSALNELGGSDGRRRKVQHKLSPELETKLRAQIMTGAKYRKSNT